MMVQEMVQLHIEKTCAGLRKLATDKHEPDYLLYVGPFYGDVPMPETISGIPVIETPAYLGGIDFGLACDLWYLPCYKNTPDEMIFRSYSIAYEDYTLEEPDEGKNACYIGGGCKRI